MESGKIGKRQNRRRAAKGVRAVHICGERELEEDEARIEKSLTGFADDDGEMRSAGLVSGWCLGSAMRFPLKYAARFGVVASATALSGCVSPPDPYNGTRPLPLPTAAILGERGSALDPSRPAIRSSGGVVQALATSPITPTGPQTFTPEKAVQFALENNPMLAAVRQQRGFAQGGDVIARTYPFNPLLQVFEMGVGGPTAAGVTNRVFSEAVMRLDLELRGQGTHRRAAAGAVTTRTEWDIATQEAAVSVAALRAFNTVLYRRKKLDVLNDTVRLNEQVVDQVKKLVALGRLRAADLILARTELDTARAQLGQGRTALALARADLRRQFGTFDDSFEVEGDLDMPVPTTEFDVYAKAALDHRPDLQARKAMVAEAQARLRLQTADRYGNPSIGPAFEYNETSATFVGMWLVTPIPVLNTRRGEILQAEATVARTAAEVRQLEVQAAQDVQAALARLAESRKWVESYTAGVLPSLHSASQYMTQLLLENDPGVDAVKVIGVQRNYLTAFSAYLDALFEVSQARADLAAAVGDPGLAVGLYPPSAKPADAAPVPRPITTAGPTIIPAPRPSGGPAKDKP